MMPATHEVHNITFYVPKPDLERVASVYREILGLSVVFAERSHIACFAAHDGDIALCLHEEEPDHPAGSAEIFVWADDPEATAAAARAVHCETSAARLSDGTVEPLINVSPGVHMRLHKRAG